MSAKAPRPPAPWLPPSSSSRTASSTARSASAVSPPSRRQASSALAALAVPPQRLDEVAGLVSALPEVFVKAVASIKVGEVAPLVRSRAGFHIIKLVERENAAQASYTQQRARHILLRSAPGQNTRELVDKMQGIRRQIMEGQASFAQQARQYSEDGSGAKGGDLGWTSPGQFVPEFEKALIGLQPGQISEPVVSRYGVHLIQLIERREAQLSDAQRREAARSVLRERKFEAAYEEWARELRAAAYVEVRDAP